MCAVSSNADPIKGVGLMWLMGSNTIMDNYGDCDRLIDYNAINAFMVLLLVISKVTVQ